MISTELALEENHITLSSVLRDKLPQKRLWAAVIAQSGSEDLKPELLSRIAEKIVEGKNIIMLSWNLTITPDFREGCPLGHCRLPNTQM